MPRRTLTKDDWIAFDLVYQLLWQVAQHGRPALDEFAAAIRDGAKYAEAVEQSRRSGK